VHAVARQLDSGEAQAGGSGMAAGMFPRNPARIVGHGVTDPRCRETA